MRRHLLDSRAAAQRAIAEGRVVVDGMPEPKAATLVGDDVAVHLQGPPPRYVSRGGDKLAGALSAFPVVVTGRRALDAGASTGGFTDCLLQHGCAAVVAVDVGYGQLHWRVRRDPRVTPVERTNLRLADPLEIGAPFDVVVADLSFISLRTLAPTLAAIGAAGTDYLLLVKPQFEAGRGRVGSGGIVRSVDVHVEVLQKVAASLGHSGLGARGATVSPITGAKGNREFFLWAMPGPATIGDDELEEVARS